jgi:hypothetical protein
MNAARKIRPSGEHQAVRDFRRKLDSIETTTLPQIQAMRKNIEALADKRASERETDPILPETEDAEESK